MKKLLFTLALIVIFSCEKQSCYRCATTYLTTTKGGTYASTVTESSSVVYPCDMTEKEARDYETKMTTTATVYIGTIKTTTVSECNCEIVK